jgi:CubicO group peptidase (beta-lactamase class C family)
MTDQPRINAVALDALLARHDKCDAPGFAVGVALGGVAGYRRGVGMASIELPVVLSPTIRMRIGSTTKHFTALAILLLAEEGLLSIESSPRELLPELPGWADAMTLQQLMGHSSGMRDSLDLLLHAAGPGVATAPDFHLRTLTGLDSINFAPGTSWNYCNGGYVLLSEIVARVSGQSFADFLRDRIFTPVGMNDTMLRPRDTDLVPNSATLHVPSPTGGWTRGVFGPPNSGEGGMVSTVDDMLRWLRHMGDPIVGSRESWRLMRTPIASHGYGLGLFMGTHRGLSTIHHAGAVVGGSSQMIKVVDCDLDIIIMTNGLGAMDLYGLVDAIIDACIPGLPPLADDVPAKPVEGNFYSAETGRKVTLDTIEGRQMVRLGGMTLPAQRDAQGWLRVPIMPTDLRILPDDDAAAIETIEYGMRDVLRRIEAPADGDAAHFVGRYESRAAAITAIVQAGTGRAASLILSNAYGAMTYVISRIGPDLWEGRAAGSLPLAVLIEGRADGFMLTSGRTQRLWFDLTSSD